MHLSLEEIRSKELKDPTTKLKNSLTQPSFYLPQPEQLLNQQPLQRKAIGEDGKLLAISKALGTRDKYTEGHGQRVSVYAARLARRLGLPDTDVENIRIGGMLHDIGKIGFSDRIFSNEAVALSQEMHEEIQNHPWTGRMILKNLNFIEPVLDCVYYHHERVDGKGYPCGLRNDEIPLGARVISVADCFDAMTTDRPYQGRKHLPEAIDTLKRISGKVLSADIVDAFIEELYQNGTIGEHTD